MRAAHSQIRFLQVNLLLMLPQNHTHPRIRSWIKQALKAGDDLAFSVIEDDGSKSLSHQVSYRRGLYVVTGLDGEHVGSYGTISAANAAGFAASEDRLEHGIRMPA